MEVAKFFYLQCGDFELGVTVKTFWSIAKIILPYTAYGKSGKYLNFSQQRDLC